MAGLTDHYNLPYPQGTDDAAIASDIQALAVSVDSAVYTAEQTLAASDSAIIDQVNSLKTNVRYTVDSVSAEVGDFVVCDSSSLINVALPNGAQEDDVVRIYRNGDGAVSISATGTINGTSLITTKNTGVIAAFTNGEWWCLPLSFSGGGGGSYVSTPAWTRPNDWIDLPITIDENTDGAYALLHFPKDTTDTIRLNLKTTDITTQFYIDWGDGATQVHAGSTTSEYVSHTYQWINLPSIGELADETRQVYIKIEPYTPTSKITEIYFVQLDSTLNFKKYVKEMVYALKFGVQAYCPVSAENFVVYTRGSNIDIDYAAEEFHQVKRIEINFENNTYSSIYRMCDYSPHLESVYLFGNCPEVYAYNALNGSVSLKTFYCDSSVNLTDIGYLFENSGITKAAGLSINGNNMISAWGAYYESSISDINGESITNSDYVEGWFSRCNNLEIVDGIDFHGNISSSEMFDSCLNLKEASNIDLSQNQYTDGVFSYCPTLKKVSNLDITGSQRADFLFSSCYALSEIDSVVDISNCTSARSMFEACYALKEIPDLVNTSNLINANEMFYYCSSITTLPSLNMSNVTDAVNLASFCDKLEWSDIYGLTVTHSYQNCNLSAAALNNIYNNLGTASTGIPIVNAYWSSNYMYFITAAPHGLVSGYYSTSGFSPSGYNRTNTYMTANGNQFYFYTTSNPGVATVLGGIYVGASAGTSITVTGNPGVSGDNPSIAWAKGWTVIG